MPITSFFSTAPGPVKTGRSAGKEEIDGTANVLESEQIDGPASISELGQIDVPANVSKPEQIDVPGTNTPNLSLSSEPAPENSPSEVKTPDHHLTTSALQNPSSAFRTWERHERKKIDPEQPPWIFLDSAVASALSNFKEEEIYLADDGDRRIGGIDFSPGIELIATYPFTVWQRGLLFQQMKYRVRKELEPVIGYNVPGMATNGFAKFNQLKGYDADRTRSQNLTLGELQREMVFRKHEVSSKFTGIRPDSNEIISERKEERDNTTYTFENGTSYTFGNVANVLGNWAGVVDGPSFFKKFAPGAAAALTIQAEEAPSSLQASAAVPGYPDAELLLPDLSIGGYYLNGTGFEDVAVLTSLSFEPDLPSDFQHLAETFFAEAKAAGKTKLVIDLSVNGGGYILQGYDLFRQLFPSIDQFGASRLRESETFIEAARAYSDAVGGDFDPNTSPDADLINIYETFLNYRYDLNITNQNFTSFAAKFGPVPLRGDEFTELIRWNFSDPITTINATWGMGMDITGYRSRQNFTQPFAAEDIIMLTDGYCASTCTLFAEFMRTQAGVKSIALGGRPEVQQIQAVGGVKGAQILSFGSIFSIAQTAIQYAGSNPVDALKKLSALPDRRSASNGINIRDNILPDNVNDGLPAQFSYEPADCRLYYTPEMIGDITATWKAAASAAFKGGKCNFGGLGKRGVERRVQRPRSAKVDKSKRREYKRVEVVRDRHWYVRHGKKVTEV
ncbi:hypothetical protein M7I_8085 [Glarea lozoyensis 74030]|uniref:Uncharacterized protein n=1 Tax=Glarea lozoyensis (strain ATCC 74030 / MF5533) TaxID=1104152 RepID=H0EZ23_GLAL7|nr:hypothetical protein M7I_8085 [Glarea lozoyensis 74030]